MELPEIRTERIILRELQPTDSHALSVLRSDTLVNEFIDRKDQLTDEDAAKTVDFLRNGIENGNWLYWAVSLQNDPYMIGTYCLMNFNEEDQSAEVGYEFLPSHQGKGYASEATQAVLDFGFNKLSLKTVTAVTTKANTASTKLLERFGFSPKPYQAEGKSYDVMYILER